MADFAWPFLNEQDFTRFSAFLITGALVRFQAYHLFQCSAAGLGLFPRGWPLGRRRLLSAFLCAPPRKSRLSKLFTASERAWGLNRAKAPGAGCFRDPPCECQEWESKLRPWPLTPFSMSSNACRRRRCSYPVRASFWRRIVGFPRSVSSRPKCREDRFWNWSCSRWIPFASICGGVRYRANRFGVRLACAKKPARRCAAGSMGACFVWTRRRTNPTASCYCGCVPFKDPPADPERWHENSERSPRRCVDGASSRGTCSSKKSGSR
jgi:hypothetical protein